MMFLNLKFTSFSIDLCFVAVNVTENDDDAVDSVKLVTQEDLKSLKRSNDDKDNCKSFFLFNLFNSISFYVTLTFFLAKRKKKRKKKKSESEASDNEEKEEIDDTDETADVNVEEKLGHTQDLSEKCILFSIFSFILMPNQILR